MTPANADQVGTFIASGIGGFATIESEHNALLGGGPRRISPFFIPATIINLADAAAFAVGAVGGGGACPQPVWDPAPAYALGATPAQIQGFLDTLKCVEDGAL